jgi:hypothetical protein
MCFRVKKTGNGKVCKPCLKLILHHGDVVIMHGADIQRVYYNNPSLIEDEKMILTIINSTHPEKRGLQSFNQLIFSDFEDTESNIGSEH